MSKVPWSHLAVVFCFLISSVSLAESNQLNGRVIDSSSGEPVKGAEVLINSTNYKAITTSEGLFSFANIPSGNHTLVIKRLGYETTTHEITLPLGETKQYDFVIAANPIQLNDIVTIRTSLVGNKDRLTKIPGSAHYLSEEELNTFKYNDINRVLREIPGINVQEEDGYGLRPNIGLRGAGADRSEKVAIMEDGVLIAPAPYSAPAAYYFPTIGRMNGIEVRKGSSQIKYGPYTTGGAINLISTPIPPTFGGKVEMYYGEDDARRIHANAGNSFDNFAFLVETFQEKVNGFKELDGGGNTGYDKKDYVGKLRFFTELTPVIYQQIELKLSQTDEVSNETYLGLTETDFEMNPYRRYAGSQKDVMNTDHEQIQLRHFVKFPKNVDITTTFYRNEFNRNWYKLDKVRSSTSGSSVGISSILDDPQIYSAEYDIVIGQTSPNDNALLVKANNRSYYSQGLESVVGLKFERHEAEIGLRYHEDELDRYQWEDQYKMQNGVMMLTTAGVPGTESNQVENAKVWAGFSQLNLAFGKLLVVPGLRYENIKLARDDYGKTDPDRTGANLSSRENKVNTLIPGIGVDYTFISSLSGFVGVHKGFAPPNSSEGTKPEESINYEAGIRFRNIDFNAQGVIFFNDYSNLLGSDLSAGGGTGTGDQFNGGAVDIMGAEMSLGYSIADGLLSRNHSIPLRFIYTYTNGKFKNDFESTFEPWGSVSKNDELPYLPKHQFYTSAGYETSRFIVSLGAKYISQMRTIAGQGEFVESNSTDAHFIIDASANYSISESIRAFLSARNLNDELYIASRRPAGIRPGLPQTLMAGLRTEF